MTIRARGLLVALILGALPTASHAACNVIPSADRRYLSIRGAIDRPIAPPLGIVEITLDPACVSDARPFNVQDPSDNVVTLGFGVPPDTRDCQSSASIAADVDEVPDQWTLRFQVPDTTAQRPDGFAGPTCVVVTSSAHPGAAPLAQIGPLRRPVDQCDGPDDLVFGHFTVLPAPNQVAYEVLSPKRLLMTIDGHANLLIPLDHAGELGKGGDGCSSAAPTPAPGRSPTPARLVEHGNGMFDAFKWQWRTISQALAVNAPPAGDDVVTAYTLCGERRDAFLCVDPRGSVYGTVDEGMSVVRVAHRAPSGTEMFDVRHRLTAAGAGPIVVANPATSTPRQQFTLGVCHEGDAGCIDVSSHRCGHGVRSALGIPDVPTIH